MFSRIVTELGGSITVTNTANNADVLDIIKRGNYSIIVLDAETAFLSLNPLLTEILSAFPATLILVTARPSSPNEELLLDALSKGAIECMTKPVYDTYEKNLEAIKRKIEYMIKILNYEEDKNTEITEEEKAEPNKTEDKKENIFNPDIVLITASTGGPRALEKIIPKLDRNFPVPILIIQHISSPFTGMLAQRLNNLSRLKVKVAQEGEKISAGTVYFAPGGIHMKLNSENKIYLDNSPPINGVRPAADALFESVADDFYGQRVLVVVLTGMGSDGSYGLTRLKNKKYCFCITQSEKTCVVYGMPRAAEENKLSDLVLDLDDISSGIQNFKYNSAEE